MQLIMAHSAYQILSVLYECVDWLCCADGAGFECKHLDLHPDPLPVHMTESPVLIVKAQNGHPHKQRAMLVAHKVYLCTHQAYAIFQLMHNWGVVFSPFRITFSLRIRMCNMRAQKTLAQTQHLTQLQLVVKPVFSTTGGSSTTCAALARSPIYMSASQPSCHSIFPSCL